MVELEPLTTEEAITFLRADAAPAPDRWDGVGHELRAAPDGALAAALSVPLMVALARTIYACPDRDPGGLVPLAPVGGQSAVEQHLLEAFVPAAFAEVPPEPGARPPAHRGWAPNQARRVERSWV